jgi:hypothetical protein
VELRAGAEGCGGERQKVAVGSHRDRRRVGDVEEVVADGLAVGAEEPPLDSGAGAPRRVRGPHPQGQETASRDARQRDGPGLAARSDVDLRPHRLPRGVEQTARQTVALPDRHGAATGQGGEQRLIGASAGRVDLDLRSERRSGGVEEARRQGAGGTHGSPRAAQRRRDDVAPDGQEAIRREGDDAGLLAARARADHRLCGPGFPGGVEAAAQDGGPGLSRSPPDHEQVAVRRQGGDRRFATGADITRGAVHLRGRAARHQGRFRGQEHGGKLRQKKEADYCSSHGLTLSSQKAEVSAWLRNV